MCFRGSSTDDDELDQLWIEDEDMEMSSRGPTADDDEEFPYEREHDEMSSQGSTTGDDENAISTQQLTEDDILKNRKPEYGLENPLGRKFPPKGVFGAGQIPSLDRCPKQNILTASIGSLALPTHPAQNSKEAKVTKASTPLDGHSLVLRPKSAGVTKASSVATSAEKKASKAKKATLKAVRAAASSSNTTSSKATNHGDHDEHTDSDLESLFGSDYDDDDC